MVWQNSSLVEDARSGRRQGPDAGNPLVGLSKQGDAADFPENWKCQTKNIGKTSVKPKNLKFPFLWVERHPVLTDGVLFVPDYYDRHREWTFPGWEAIFGNSNPVNVEYCTGNGAWIIDKARTSKNNWVAVEWRFDRVRKIWSKMKNFNISNLFIVCGEALTFTREYLPKDCISEVYINFPDPWPKEKHAKNRLFQEPFVSELTRVVKNRATIVTDDETYANQLHHEMSKKWRPVFSSPHFITDWPDYGTSYFDALWREKGCTIRYFQYERH